MKTKDKTIRERISDYERGYIRDPESDSRTQMRTAEVDAFQKAQAAMEALLDATNVMGCDQAVQAGIFAGLERTHRYLQGQGIVAILTALGEYGHEARTDPRNEHAVQTCKLLTTALRDRI